jgi:hypothetical protein
MFRKTIIALAAAATLGTSVASAAPFNVPSIATAAAESGSLQRVTWYRPRPHVSFVQHRYHRHSAAARMSARDEVCFLRGRRGDPRLFMRQQASGCF